MIAQFIPVPLQQEVGVEGMGLCWGQIKQTLIEPYPVDVKQVGAIEDECLAQ